MKLESLGLSRAAEAAVGCLLSWLLVILIVAFIGPGCSSSAGPGTVQNASGQVTTNTGGDKLTVTDLPDGTGTSTLAGTGPSFFSNQDSLKSAVRGTGLVPTTVVVETSADARKFSYFSAKDGSGKILVDPATGNPTSVEFVANASDPIKAFATVAQVKADLERSITEQQAAVLKQLSSDQRDTILGVVDKISPVISAALKAAWPVP